MHFSFAVVAALVAGQAYASTVNVFPRQTPDELLKMIPAACSSTCQPLANLQTECGSATDPIGCVCKASNVKAMDDCIKCVGDEITKTTAGSGVDPATIQAGLDSAQQTFRDMCKDAGGSTGGFSSGTTTAAASGSTGTAGSTLGNGNSGVRVEFAGSALLGVAGLIGALLL